MSQPTLAKVLKTRQPDRTWNECRAAIHSGRVTVNGEVVTDDTHRVGPEDEVVCHAKPLPRSAIRASTAQATPHDLKVYYVDDHIIVAEKPTSIESVPFETNIRKTSARGQQVLTFIDICHRWLERREGRSVPKLKIVQRLDKGTSGIMVFARTALAERQLGKLFREHDIERSYTAFCVGEAATKTIDSRLVENRGDGKRGSTKNPKLGKTARTHVKTLETRKTASGQTVSKIQCRLETWRTHQIRIHMCESGHPLCGEDVYRSSKPFSEQISDRSKIPRIGLHAATLGFRHPVHDELMVWESQLPDDLDNWWDSMNS